MLYLTIFGKLNFEIAVGPIGPLSGPTFRMGGGRFPKSKTSSPEVPGVAPRPNMGAKTSQLAKLLKTVIVGALRIYLGLLSCLTT